MLCSTCIEEICLKNKVCSMKEDKTWPNEAFGLNKVSNWLRLCVCVCVAFFCSPGVKVQRRKTDFQNLMVWEFLSFFEGSWQEQLMQGPSGTFSPLCPGAVLSVFTFMSDKSSRSSSARLIILPRTNWQALWMEEKNIIIRNQHFLFKRFHKTWYLQSAASNTFINLLTKILTWSKITF